MAIDLTSRLEELRGAAHRRRWWIRLAAAIVILPWLTPFVYTRWTRMPPLPPLPPGGYYNLDAALNIPPPEVDRSPQMSKALEALPSDPSISVPTTAPAGMKWVKYPPRGPRPPVRPPATMSAPAGAPAFSPPITPINIIFDPCVALNGQWTPATRLHLSTIIEYLKMPETEQALTAIAALCEKPLCFGFGNNNFTTATDLPTLTQARQVARLFTTRARYYLAEKNDLDRSCGDIETVFHLAANLEDDGSIISLFVDLAIRSLALSEIVNWPDEYNLTRAQLAQLLRLVQKHPLNLPRAWTLAFQGENKLMTLYLDTFYTRDEQGRGWLVLYRGKPDRIGNNILLSLNLLSPLFDDRQRIHQKLDSWTQANITSAGKPYRQAKQRDADLEQAIAQLGPWGPPLNIMPRYTSSGRAGTLCTRTQVTQDGTVIAIALAAYQADHGRYPQALTELVSGYLAALPSDPFSDEPFRYRPEDGGYVLYSVDDNGVDDGGDSDRGGPPGAYRDPLDWPIERKRRNPAGDAEWILVPIGEDDEGGR